MKKLFGCVALALMLIGTGCQKTVTAPVPGSYNQFDSDSYLALVTAKGAIDQAKAELAANSFKPPVDAAVKKAVNDAVTAYNVADTTYQAFHASLASGSATGAQQQALQAQVSTMNSAVGSITVAKGAK